MHAVLTRSRGLLRTNLGREHGHVRTGGPGLGPLRILDCPGGPDGLVSERRGLDITAVDSTTTAPTTGTAGREIHETVEAWIADPETGDNLERMLVRAAQDRAGITIAAAIPIAATGSVAAVRGFHLVLRPAYAAHGG